MNFSLGQAKPKPSKTEAGPGRAGRVPVSTAASVNGCQRLAQAHRPQLEGHTQSERVEVITTANVRIKKWKSKNKKR
jgi:hypothetical protein